MKNGSLELPDSSSQMVLINTTDSALWNQNAANETRMVCIPDSQLIVRQGIEAKAADVWVTASRATSIWISRLALNPSRLPSRSGSR